jgi:hypothetical protein
MDRAHLSYPDWGLYAKLCIAKEFQDVRFAAGARHKKPLLREKFQCDGTMLTKTGRYQRNPLVMGKRLGINHIRNR